MMDKRFMLLMVVAGNADVLNIYCVFARYHFQE